MSHYAKVVNGLVTQVIVAEADFFQTFIDTSPGEWVQTYYNTYGGIHYGSDGKPDGGIALRANYATIGGTYDKVNDVFYAPRPLDTNGNVCASWTLNSSTWLWTPPIPMPADGKYYEWNETGKTWVAITVAA